MMWNNRSYKKIRLLAEGYQSTVWLAEDTNTKTLVAIKGTDLSYIESYKALQYLRNEQLCLETIRRELKNPRKNTIAHYPVELLRVAYLLKVFYEDDTATNDSEKTSFDTSSSSGCLFFVFKFIPGVTLNKYIAKQQGIIESEARYFAAELILILGALHERGFVYRDLKATNIILEPSGRLTLIDFGFAKFIGPRGKTRSLCGTLHAMPPEMYVCEAMKREQSEKMLSNLAAFEEENSVDSNNLSLHNTNLAQNTLTIQRSMKVSASSPSLSGNLKSFYDSYGMEVDWWALGILVYEMIFCKPPFGYQDYSLDKKTTIKKLSMDSPNTLKFPESPKISKHLENFIRDLLQSDRTKRLGYKYDARIVSNAPWFDGFDWNQLKDPAYTRVLQFNFTEDDY